MLFPCFQEIRKLHITALEPTDRLKSIHCFSLSVLIPLQMNQKNIQKPAMFHDLRNAD